MMLSSLLANIEDFFVTGFISLAIVLATLRAQFARLSSSFEWPSFLGAFIICLTLTLSLYLYLSVARYVSRRRGDGEEEEWDALRDLEEATGRRFHVLPVSLAWRQHDGQSPSSRAILRLDCAGSDSALGKALLEYHIEDDPVHTFPPRPSLNRFPQ